MNIHFVLGCIGAGIGILLMIGLLALAIWFIAWFLMSWNRAKRARQTAAEAQRQRHGGQTVLEWNRLKAAGEPDPEFGELLELFPRKGGGEARFFERGLDLNGKRVPYDSLADVFFDPGSEERGKDLKEAIQNSAVLWLYRKKGSTLAIRDFQYGFDHDAVQAIQNGLGFRGPEE